VTEDRGGWPPPGRPRPAEPARHDAWDDEDPGPWHHPGPSSPAGDEYEDRFVPGFGDEPDEADEPDEPGPYRTDDRYSAGDEYRTDEPVRAGPLRAGSPRAAGSRPPRNRRRRRRFRWIAPLVALLVIVVPLAVGGVYAYNFYMSRYHPPDYPGDGTGYLVVQVPPKASATSLGPKLQQLGVVASARAFVLAAEHSPNPAGLLPGFYGMRRHMKASLAYALLINPKNLVQVPVTIPEGWRVSQVVAWLGAKSGIPASAYAKVLAHPAPLHLPASAHGRPEGYLFPATYQVQPHETALGVLTAMVRRFGQAAAALDLPAAARRVHLTERQVIIMASLVEAEGGRLPDFGKIARVIYNRLARGIPLQLDSTVLYGLNQYGILASDKQLGSRSPYNTYKHKGLPPGPIDNPGNAAIRAVLHPAAGPWLYFVTVNPKTGETKFTSSQAQFQQYRQELASNLARR
jgi:UPF0755 protein